MEWPHLFVDGRGCDPGQLRDPEHVRAYLETLPDEIHMTKITQPFVCETPLGITGIVIIAESHIGVHTYADADAVSLDVFSCRPFEPGPIVDAIRRHWTMAVCRWRILERSHDSFDASHDPIG